MELEFHDEEFEKACRELDEPDLTDYEFFIRSSGVQIHRKYRQNSGLYEYKMFGTLEGVGPKVCYEVYNDLDYRKCWDSYASKLLEINEDGRRGIYWRVNFPFLMSPRDYVFIRDSREFDVNGQHIWVTLGRSSPFKSRPPKTGVIRVDDFQQSMVMAAGGDNGTKAFMHYYDNPKGMIPTFLINWAAKTGVPGFIKSMTDACNGYPAYLAKKKKKGKGAAGEKTS